MNRKNKFETCARKEKSVAKNYTNTTRIIKIANRLFIVRIAEIRSPSPFESSVLQVLPDLSSKQCHRGFPGGGHVFIIPHNVRYSITSIPLSLSLSTRLVGPFLYSCSTFCKSSDISTGMRSTFNLAPVNERTLISLSRVSRVRDSGVAWWVLRYAHNEPPAFRHRAWWFFNYSIRPDV